MAAELKLKPYVETPCSNCPWHSKFRGEDDYLREGRREGIVKSMLEGDGFPCHKTTVPSEDGFNSDVTPKSKECAGAMLMFLRADRAPQQIRILERLGYLDAEAFLESNAEVDLWTFEELTGDHDVETCSVVEDGCEAPAGYMVGGEAVHGTVAAENTCRECGEPFCDNEGCGDAERELCATCIEWGRSQ